MDRFQMVVLPDDRTVKVHRATVGDIADMLERNKATEGGSFDRELDGWFNVTTGATLSDLLTLTDLTPEEIRCIDVGDLERIAQTARAFNPDFFVQKERVEAYLQELMRR
jgi:hypothetical protein